MKISSHFVIRQDKKRVCILINQHCAKQYQSKKLETITHTD